LDRCGLYKEHISQLKREIVLQSGEAECLKKEEVLTSENQNENEARRIEVNNNYCTRKTEWHFHRKRHIEGIFIDITPYSRALFIIMAEQG
jgi:hypothetical protein